VTDLERFQNLQLDLVRGGFDSTLRAHREEDHAIVSMSVALHREQAPDLMAELTKLVEAHGCAFTAEGEKVDISVLHPPLA
jgi:hypothetical protein